MPFQGKKEKYSSSVRAVTIGRGERAVTIGGESAMPFCSFDSPSENPPRIGVLVRDDFPESMAGETLGMKSFYEGASSIPEFAARAAKMPGADFIVLNLAGANPHGENRSVESCTDIVREVLEAIEVPLAVEGCGSTEKDAELFAALSEAFEGENLLFLSAKEENYREVAKAACLTHDQKISAESSVDINLAKQLNVLLLQEGVDPSDMMMNVGSAAAGYGFEYVISTLERVRLAALGQNDVQLQLPIITPVAEETWNVKESTASEEEMPEWGPLEERGVAMETETAVAVLACGSDAVILKHPDSVAAVSELIHQLS